VAVILGELGAPQDLQVDEVRSVTLVPSASAGVAVSESGDSFSDVLQRADIALYHAKQISGAPQLYTPDLRQPWSHRHKTEDGAEPQPEGVGLSGLIAEQASP
jgi:predicted signal transduction protein with EAL and GGDEF domain